MDNLFKNSNDEFFGTLIHKLFSITDWIEDCPSENDQHQVLLEIGASKDQAKQAILAFKNYLKLDSVSKFLKKPQANILKNTSIFTEKPFVYRDGDSLMQGRIDRLVINAQKGELIDFKTGKTPEATSEKISAYNQQLIIYKKAAVVLFPDVEFEAKLVF